MPVAVFSQVYEYRFWDHCTIGKPILNNGTGAHDCRQIVTEKRLEEIKNTEIQNWIKK